MQGIICPTLSIFQLIIREKNKFSYEVPRLWAYPVIDFDFIAIWMHDSLSAKKVRFNPAQVEYYGITTWAIIQAFTSPLSIFYRFHSCVCLADIWQEVYHDSGNQDASKHGKHRLVNTNGGHHN